MHKILNNKVLLFIVGVLLLANITMFILFIRMKEPAKREYRGDKKKSPVAVFLENELLFNKQQMAEFEKLRQEHRQKMKPLFEDLRLSKVRFYELLNNVIINDSLLEREASKIGEMQKAMDLQAFQNFRELRSLCRPEQQSEYDSLISGVIGRMWFPSKKGNNHSKESSLPGKR